MNFANQSLPLEEIPDLIVRGKRVITPSGLGPASIHIREGIISAIGAYDALPAQAALYDAADFVVMPGIVDTHVHINEPGRTEWEGFTTATRAAAAGGVTTLIEMPLNSIPTTTSEAAFREKIAAAAGKLWVDTGFWGGVVPGNTSELAGLWSSGAFGFKCFLVPSGVAEFAHVGESELRAALGELASLEAPLLVHAESPDVISAATIQAAGASPQKHQSWLASRPAQAENDAIALVISVSAEFHARIHIVHLSSSEAIPQLKQAKHRKLPVTVETCPHYLSFCAEEIPEGATEYKCAPPIRERENRESLWAALGDGTIDFLATDHSPCPPSMKARESGNFFAAWGGISSLQLSLPALWTEARSRGYAVERVAEWLSARPARLPGLERKKGAIAVGCDADLAIWNPDGIFRVDETMLHHRHKLTPYLGRELAGVVEATFLRGRKIYEHGEFCAGPAGKVLRRGEA
jgi:allantoinase